VCRTRDGPAAARGLPSSQKVVSRNLHEGETIMASKADTMTEKMSHASRTGEFRGPAPKKGERFRCEKCGMEIQVTADCHCAGDEHARFQCCGQELVKV
jgi:hypothetical protein